MQSRLQTVIFFLLNVFLSLFIRNKFPSDIQHFLITETKMGGTDNNSNLTSYEGEESSEAEYYHPLSP